ncbi:MAG: hypothetical protein K2L83_00785 [Muribaculaceae bacterium]|nr:hypothetical protein [Muribaculaceae bacterium]
MEIEVNVMISNVQTRRRGSSVLMMAGLLAIASTLSACGGDKEAGEYPADFNRMSDAAKVAYMMEHASPDSVARFICLASIGDVDGVRIDTLANATLYAYENYKDGELQDFVRAYDECSARLPLSKRMALGKRSVEQDPMGLGYELGLTYVNEIREQHLDAARVEKEIRDLQEACMRNPEDSATFRRFMTGFKVALERDGSSDVPEEIFRKYAQL